jgi:hypothetical protein
MDKGITHVAITGVVITNMMTGSSHSEHLSESPDAVFSL